MNGGECVKNVSTRSARLSVETGEALKELRYGRDRESSIGSSSSMVGIRRQGKVDGMSMGLKQVAVGREKLEVVPLECASRMLAVTRAMVTRLAAPLPIISVYGQGLCFEGCRSVLLCYCHLSIYYILCLCAVHEPCCLLFANYLGAF
jgi:hypothetical protein